MDQHRQRIASTIGNGYGPNHAGRQSQEALVRELRRSVQELERELERKNAVLEKTMALLMNQPGHARAPVTDRTAL